MSSHIAGFSTKRESEHEKHVLNTALELLQHTTGEVVTGHAIKERVPLGVDIQQYASDVKAAMHRIERTALAFETMGNPPLVDDYPNYPPHYLVCAKQLVDSRLNPSVADQAPSRSRTNISVTALPLVEVMDTRRAQEELRRPTSWGSWLNAKINPVAANPIDVVDRAMHAEIIDNKFARNPVVLPDNSLDDFEVITTRTLGACAQYVMPRSTPKQVSSKPDDVGAYCKIYLTDSQLERQFERDKVIKQEMAEAIQDHLQSSRPGVRESSSHTIQEMRRRMDEQIQHDIAMATSGGFSQRRPVR